MNRVLQLRQDHCMQQKELSIAIGVSKPTVSEWEHQKKDPSGERLRKLAEFFNVAPSYILGAPVVEKTIIQDDEQLQFALFGGADGITKEDLEDVKRYAQFILAKKQGFGERH